MQNSSIDYTKFYLKINLYPCHLEAKLGNFYAIRDEMKNLFKNLAKIYRCIKILFGNEFFSRFKVKVKRYDEALSEKTSEIL